MQQQSIDWHTWRKQGIGGSDAPVVMGVSPYRTLFELWEEKTSRATYDTSNWATQRGNELEPKARAAYELINDSEMPAALLQHPTISYIRASLDGYNAELKKAVEIKYQGLEAHENTKDGLVALHYIPQLQHQLLIPDIESVDFISYNDTVGTAHVITVLPDKLYQATLLEAEARFWEMVTLDIAPPFSDRDFKLIRNKDISPLLKEWLKMLSDSDKSKVKELEKLISAKLTHPRMKWKEVRVIKALEVDEYVFSLAEGNSA